MSDEIKVDSASYCGEVTINYTISADKIMACHCTGFKKLKARRFARWR